MTMLPDLITFSCKFIDIDLCITKLYITTAPIYSAKITTLAAYLMVVDKKMSFAKGPLTIDNLQVGNDNSWFCFDKRFKILQK